MRTEKKVTRDAQEHSTEAAKTSKSESGSPIVDIIGRLGITGNVIPAEWYQTVKSAGGTPDWVTITILSEIVYWYRPKLIRKDGRSRFVKRFAGDLLQLRRGVLEKKFGVSKRHVSRSLEKLEKLGVVRRHLHTLVLEAGGKLGNVLYIELLPDGLAMITGVPLPETSGGIDTDGNSSGQGGQVLLPNPPGAIASGIRTNTKITTQTTTISCSSGAKRPRPGDKITNRKNSSSAETGAAAPGPAAPAGSPSAESGLPPRTPQTDPEFDRAKRRADKLIRFLDQAHQNLLRDKYAGLPVLGDRMEKARNKIEEYLQLNPALKVACILEVILTCWMYDLSSECWFSKKLGASPNLLWKRFGLGERQKDETALEGAAREQEIDLFRATDNTRKVFAEGGILESWEAENRPNPGGSGVCNQNQNHEGDSPDVEQPINVEPELKDSAPGPVQMRGNPEVTESKKLPPSLNVGRAPADRPSSSRPILE